MASEAFDLAEHLQTPGLRDVRSRSRHEQLDVRSVRVSRQADQPRQGPERDDWSASEGSSATRMWMATALAIAPCPGTDHPPPPTSPAAADTTRRRSTASVPTITTTTWSGWPASSRRPRSGAAAGWWNRKVEVGIIAFGTSHWALVESLRPVADRNTTSTPITCACAPTPLRRKCTTLSPRTSGFTSSSRTATRRCSACSSSIWRPSRSHRLRSVRHFNGLPLDARSVTDEIVSQEGK